MPTMARAKGQGTIVPTRPTPTGQPRWVVAVTMADGRRVYRRARSPREAERIRVQLVAARELVLDPTRLTLEVYLRGWIADLRRVRRQRLKGTTLAQYEDIVERVILPALGTQKLASPTMPQRIQAWADSLDASPASVRHYHGILRHALDRAVKQRMLAWNPASVTELPSLPRHSIAKPMTVPQIRAFLAATANDRLAALWRLAVVTGMRSGELRGLSWDDVGPTWVAIRQQLQRVPPERGGDANGWALTSLKVERTTDRVSIDEDTAAMLEAHRRRMAAERGPGWQYHGLVFLTERGRPLSTTGLLDLFHDACKRAGIPRRRVHDLRHTNLHLLNDIGIAEEVRMARAGHLSKQVARAYAGASEVQDRLAAETLERAIGGQS